MALIAHRVGIGFQRATRSFQAGRCTVVPMTTTVTPTKTRFEPTEVAPETFLIHDHNGEGHAPVSVGVNSMVIRAAEPVVVDTGVAENQDQYLADVFSPVDPEDIRWVFISHDDVDHTGNLNALMAAAPNATVVVNWFIQERMGATRGVSPLRQRWVGSSWTGWGFSPQRAIADCFVRW